MNKYKQVLLFLKSKKAKKIDLPAQMTLLAIAKECDRLNLESISLSDEKLLELINEEFFQYAINLVGSLFEVCGDVVNEVQSINFINGFCTHNKCDLEELCKGMTELKRKLKKIPYAERIDMMHQIRGYGLQ